jgi:ribosomal protein S18 acetylase RimI-like enzyme
MKEVELKQLAPGDAGVLLHIADDVFDEPVDPKRLAAYLAEPNHFMIVAIADGVVVGQCAAVIHRHPDKVTELYIDEVGVAESSRRKGIAKRMLDKMFALGKSLGCKEAWVGTEHDSVAARRLYESRGAEAEPFVMYLYEL